MIPLFKAFMAPDITEFVQRVFQPQPDGGTYLGQGSWVEQFELALQDVLALPYPPLTTNSCTSAIDLALHLIGVQPGDEVISTPMSCSATNLPLIHRNACIVWADIDPLTGLIDPHDVARKLTPRTKAIVAVDWGGRVCDYEALKQHAVPVLQDAALSFLATGRGRGDYVCWSFQAIKHLTTGDGGALLAPPEQMERARLLRWYGLDRRLQGDARCEQDISEAGYKYHMNNVAAGIGLANVRYIQWVVDQHRHNARLYHQALRTLDTIQCPAADEGSAWWCYAVLVDDAAPFRHHMAEHDIATSPVNRRNDTYRVFAPFAADLPGVDAFTAREVAIPVHWGLSDDQREQVFAAVRSWRRAG